MTGKTSSVFAWSEVEPAFLRRLLIAYGSDLGDPRSVADLKPLTRDQLANTAAHNLGRPPRRAAMRGDAVVDLLRHTWLPKQPVETVDAVIRLLSVGLRRQAPPTKPARLGYLAALNRTETLSLALRRAFIAAHKTTQSVRRRAVSVGEQKATGAIVLRGSGLEPLQLYDHQALAQQRLTAWARKKPSGGVLVLPTGAGKTATAITWLLEWLAASSDRKVLWLAHQRELVDQAARSFARLAASRSPDFECRLRLIHGAGSALSTLSEPGLRVAVATMQTLRPNGDDRRIEALRRFSSASTIVVVDEAHRAASATYVDLLDLLQAQPGVRVLGLTATPTPSGAVARRRLLDRFSEPLLSVNPGELIQLGILARPVFHKVDTHVSVEMSAEDLRRSLAIDIPDSVLKQLAAPVRNQVIVDTWLADEAKWGKTLVFATSIRHADDLAGVFTNAGADARVIHSRSSHQPGSTLDWFRASTRNPVLVSVGMLTEGVDLPDAQTAFLARPTTSAILMRQMVGRVLRGPKAHGTHLAHLVTLHDDWVNFTGVIEPIDLTNLPEAQPEQQGRNAAAPTLRLVTSDGTSIPSGVLAQIQRLYADHAAVASQGAHVSQADLMGYYELSETRIPVFRHQSDSFEVLIDDLRAGATLQGRPALSYFADDPLPYPTEKSLAELVREVRETGGGPALVLCQVLITPDATAARIRAAGARTEDERYRMLRSGWDDGGCTAYETFDHWHEAVDRTLRELTRRAAHTGTISEPEAISRPIKARLVARALPLLFQQTVAGARELLDSSDTRARLARLPTVVWSKRLLKTVHAHWTLKKAGPVITVSCSLKVSPKHVGDELFRYLLWHELLHHVLPGHGHDAEFRHLEARWPRALDLDRELDTLHERIGA